MLQAAEFGALAAEAARAVRLNPFGGDVRRNQVALAVESRHPETVDHILRRPANLDRPAHGDVDLIRGYGDALGIVVQVADVPPPLVAGDFDRQAAARAGESGDGFTGRDAGDEQ